MAVVMDYIVARSVLQDRIAQGPRVQCRPPRKKHAKLTFLVKLLVTPNGRNEVARTGLVRQPRNGVFRIAQNVDVMPTRMQFTRERQHMLT